MKAFKRQCFTILMLFAARHQTDPRENEPRSPSNFKSLRENVILQYYIFRNILSTSQYLFPRPRVVAPWIVRFFCYSLVSITLCCTKYTTFQKKNYFVLLSHEKLRFVICHHVYHIIVNYGKL